MKRSYQPWTPQVRTMFAMLVVQGISNVEIARILGRSVSVINNYKRKLNLITRHERCQNCQAPLASLRTGRPPMYCGPECTSAARVERQRVIRQEAIEARRNRPCANADCQNLLPPENLRQRFCSRLCSGRTRELTYRRPEREISRKSEADLSSEP